MVRHNVFGRGKKNGFRCLLNAISLLDSKITYMSTLYSSTSVHKSYASYTVYRTNSQQHVTTHSLLYTSNV